MPGIIPGQNINKTNLSGRRYGRRASGNSETTGALPPDVINGLSYTRSGIRFAWQPGETGLWQGKAAVACTAHNRGVGGSNPPPALPFRGTVANLFVERIHVAVE